MKTDFKAITFVTFFFIGMRRKIRHIRNYMYSILVLVFVPKNIANMRFYTKN